MKSVRIPLLVSILCMAHPLWAGGGVLFLRHAGQAVATREVMAPVMMSPYLDRTLWQASRAAQLAQIDRAVFLQEKRLQPFQQMATLSAPVGQVPSEIQWFSLKNDKIALPWFETIEKDLTFLQTHYQAIRHALHAETVDLDVINYASIIPSSARKIYVGEEHHQPIISKAFEQMVFQYLVINHFVLTSQTKI